MMPGVNDEGMEGAANANIEMMKVALKLKESDDESIISSKGGSDSGEEERDLLKALAQRATDPYIKARKAKGPFVYIKPRLRPGRHMYVDEEIEKTQDAYLEEQLRQKLKGAQYRVTGLVKFDKHGQAKGFEVQEVAAAISSAVRAVLQEERAATGGSLGGQHSSQQEQLDTEFANKVAERTAWSDPVFEEAVRAARSEAFTASTVSPYQPQAPINRKPLSTASPSAQPLTGPPTASSVMPPPPTSPPAQPFTGPSTAQGWPPASSSPGQFTSPYPFQKPLASPDQLSSSHPLHHLQQPPPSPTSGWDGLQQHPSGTPSHSTHRQQPPASAAAGWDGVQQPFPGTAPHSIRIQQSPPTSVTPWGGPHQGPQILNLEQSGPPTSSPEASFSASPSFAPLPRSPAQQQQQPEGWEGYSQPAGHTSHPTSPFLQQQQQQGVVEQHTHVPLGSMHHQDISSGPYLQQQGWTQGEGHGTWSVERDSRKRDDGRRYPKPDTRGFPEEVRDFDHSRGCRGYDREGRGAHCHDDGRAHGRDRHERHKHSRGGQEKRSSSSSRERHRQRRHQRHHHQGRRDRYQADGMRHGSREVDGMRVRVEDKGRYGRGDEPRGHQHSSRREGKEYKEERNRTKGDSRRGERRMREGDHRVGGKEGHHRHRSKHEKDDRHRQPESRHREDSGAQSRDAYHSRSKDAYSRDARYSRSKDAHKHSQPNTSTQAPRTAATDTSKSRAKKQQPESETDSQASKDSGFPGLEAVLQSEEAAAFLRPAVSSASEADPNPEAPPRNPAEIKAKLHGNPKGRLMHEARKEHWTSSDDDGGFSEYVRQSKAPE